MVETDTDDAEYGTGIERLEEAIPESRKELSFGGEGEDIIDVMERAEKKQHHRGLHMDDPLDTCPFCPDPDNEKVSPQVYPGGRVE